MSLSDAKEREDFKNFCLINYGINENDFDRAFEILEDDSKFEEFIESNSDKKSILKIYAQIFGRVLSNEEFANENLDEFNIKNMDKYKEKYLQLYELYNMERYANPAYEFRIFTFGSPLTEFNVKRKEDEPDWKINPDLYEFVYKDIPRNLSIEEKAIYVYGKLCEGLRYDQGYFYRAQMPREDRTYEEDFSKERLEKLIPGSKITCFDFSRVFAKFLNEMDGDIEAVIILLGVNKGHSLVGFYTDNVSVMADAIREREGKTNDLFRVKNGMEIEGVRAISDRKGILKTTIKKVSKLLNLRGQGIQSYISELERLPKELIPNNMEAKFSSFIQMLESNDIKGNEAVQSFLAIASLGFFGRDISKVFLGEKIEENGKQVFKRLVAIQNGESRKNNMVYLFDSEEMNLGKMSKEELGKKIETGEYTYESGNYVLGGEK